MATKKTKPRTSKKRTKKATGKKRPRKRDDAATLIASIYGPQVELLEKELARQEKMGSRATRSTIVRWLIDEGLKPGSPLGPMPKQH